MKLTLLLLSFFGLALSGCIRYGAVGARPLPTPYGITSASGAEQARQDIAAGKIRLLRAGTIGIHTPGVPFEDTRFAHISRHTLPVGCMTPNAGSWINYAEGYNSAVLAHLQKRDQR